MTGHCKSIEEFRMAFFMKTVDNFQKGVYNEMKKRIGILAVFLSLVTFASCNLGGTASSSSVEDPDTSSFSSSSSSQTSEQNPDADQDSDDLPGEEKPMEIYPNYDPETQSPYLVEDVVKPDLLWDTQTLFATIPQIKDEGEVPLGENITSFKFASVPYLDKERTWVFAAIGMPNAEKYPKPANGYPAVVLVHGGSGQVYPQWIQYWTDKGYVALALDIFANQLDTDGSKVMNAEGGPDESKAGSLYDDPNNTADSWVYHCVHNVIMCNNLLRNNAAVNPKQIAITGISWGGVVTNLVSGVDKRFAAFAPIYGAGYLYEDSFWTSKGTFGGDSKDAWIAAYDPSQYIAYNVKPTLYVSGVDDNCFATINRMRSAKLAKGKVFYSQRSDLEHGYTWAQTYEVYAFFEHILFGKDTMSFIGDTRIEGNRIYFETENDKFDNVQLVYTTSTDTDSHKWTFKTQLVSIKNGWCTMPAGITAYCFEFIHGDIDENYRLSTPIVQVNV